MRLRSHLALLVLGALLPLLIVTAVIVRQELQDQRAVLDQGMRNTARALSLAVDGEVKASQAMLETLAASAYLDAGNLQAFHELSTRALAGRTNAYIVLFEATGQQLVNSSRPFGSPLPNPLLGTRPAGTDPRYPDVPVGGAAPVKNVFATGRPVVSDLFVSLVTRQPRISVDVPVVRSGIVRYVLELSFDPDVFTRLLKAHLLPGDSVASILDRKGLVVARSADAAGQIGRPLAPDLAAQTARSDEASDTGLTFEGLPVYHVFTRSGSTGWGTSLATSRASIGQSLRRSVTLLAGGVAFAVLLAGVLAFVIGRRISLPISTLARSAASLARGERVELQSSVVREMTELHDALVTAGMAVREVAAERHGREIAEAAERRASFLARATTALASSLEYETTLRAVADLVVPQVADGCAFDVAADGGPIRRLALRHRDPAKEAIAWELCRRYPAERDDLIQKVLATRRAALLPAVDDDALQQFAHGPDHLALLRAVDTLSIIVAPIVVRDAALGTVTFVSSTPARPFAAPDLALAEDLALRVGYAVDNARLYRDATLAREAADAASRAKDEFLATLSHELRTPLNAVYGWARMLRTRQIPDDAAERALDAIIRNANVQVQLIDDLLDVSRVTAGKMRLDIRSVDLRAVIEAALDAVAPAAAAKEIRVESVLDSSAASIMGDPARLQQVVWNLLMNAVKFTPRGGRVGVHLRIGAHVEIVVSDTGQGIAPEVLPFIFERFRQADSSSTRAHTGLGLGLALVKHLTELHGGSVVAESAGEGTGATFVVRLPLPLAQMTMESGLRAHPASASAGPAPSAVPLGGLKVLVVDDDRDALDLASAILGAAGATVQTCSSAMAALRILPQWRPDVLVADIEMPGEDGYALIRKVRTLDADRGGKIPAVALTAYGRVQDRLRSLTAGYNMHVPKPVDPGELTAIIASLAGRPTGPMRASDA